MSAAILGGPNTTMIGNIIQTQYVQNANYPVASALALILMAALLAGMYLYARAFGTRIDPGVRLMAASGDASSRRRRAAGAGRVPSCPATWSLVIAYTLVPIAVMVLYGFNQAPSGRLTFAWQGFTTRVVPATCSRSRT